MKSSRSEKRVSTYDKKNMAPGIRIGHPLFSALLLFVCFVRPADTTCGGYLESNYGEISSPGFPEDEYPYSADCVWRINATDGGVIYFYFHTMDIEHDDNCDYDWLEIRDGLTDDDPVLKKYCGSHDALAIETTGPYAHLWFHSDGSVNLNGFHLSYSTTPDDFYTLSSNTTCGGYLESNNGEINSPGFPGYYPINMDCTWTIKVNENDIIYLYIHTVDIEGDMEDNGDCPHDWLEIRDGLNDDDPVLMKYCGSHDALVIETTGPYAHLWFHSDESVNLNGFHLSYSTTPDDFYTHTTCGGYLESNYGEISSPGFPEDEYPDNANCVWRINATDGGVIYFYFHTMDIEHDGSCHYDWLEIRDGLTDDDPVLMKYCGSHDALTIETTGPYAHLWFHSDEVVNWNGFHLSYSTTPDDFYTLSSNTTCGGYLESNNGEINSPGFPGYYPINMDCTWTIKVNENDIIYLYIHTVDIEGDMEDNGDCPHDWLEIRDGLNDDDPVLMKYCGSHNALVIETTGPYAHLWFHSDESVNSNGFHLSYSTTTDDFYTQATSCGEVVTDDFGIYDHHTYDHYAYGEVEDCVWLFNVTKGNIIIFHMPYMYIDPSFDCSNAWLEVRDGLTETDDLLVTYCGNSTTSDPIITTDSFAYARLHVDHTAVEYGYVSFITLWYSKPTDISSDVVCGEPLYNTMTQGIIVSPGFPDLYPNNEDCVWTVFVSEERIIHFTFLSMDIELADDCNHDWVEIRDGQTDDNTLLIKHCGGRTNETVTTTGPNAYVRFSSNAVGTGKGFDLFYISEPFYVSSNTACGGYLESNNGEINSPGFPGNYPLDMDCTWIIKVNENDVIYFYIHTVDIEGDMEDNDDCPHDWLEIRDGLSDDDPVLMRYCGSYDALAIETTGPYAHLSFHSDESVNLNGFHLSYSTTPDDFYTHGSIANKGFKLSYATKAKTNETTSMTIGPEYSDLDPIYSAGIDSLHESVHPSTTDFDHAHSTSVDSLHESVHPSTTDFDHAHSTSVDSLHESVHPSTTDFDHAHSTSVDSLHESVHPSTTDFDHAHSTSVDSLHESVHPSTTDFDHAHSTSGDSLHESVHPSTTDFDHAHSTSVDSLHESVHPSTTDFDHAHSTSVDSLHESVHPSTTDFDHAHSTSVDSLHESVHPSTTDFDHAHSTSGDSLHESVHPSTTDFDHAHSTSVDSLHESVHPSTTDFDHAHSTSGDSLHESVHPSTTDFDHAHSTSGDSLHESVHPSTTDFDHAHSTSVDSLHESVHPSTTDFDHAHSTSVDSLHESVHPSTTDFDHAHSTSVDSLHESVHPSTTDFDHAHSTSGDSLHESVHPSTTDFDHAHSTSVDSLHESVHPSTTDFDHAHSTSGDSLHESVHPSTTDFDHAHSTSVDSLHESVHPSTTDFDHAHSTSVDSLHESVHPSTTDFDHTTHSTVEDNLQESLDSLYPSETSSISTIATVSMGSNTDVNPVSELDSSSETIVFSSISPTSPTSTAGQMSSSVTQITTTPATTKAPVTVQKDLYPYGLSTGDSSFNQQQWASDRITFKTNVPFGRTGFSQAYVLLEGVVSFGEHRYAWSMDFAYEQRRERHLLAVFWSWMSYYEDMTIYYHLYERDDEVTDALTESILARATKEVTENYGNTDFVARAVLVATWDRVKPYNWYSWLCDFYWWYDDYYYTDIYEAYCLGNEELNTFQAVYISDGKTAFAIRRYKSGGMFWRFDPYRPVQIGFVSDKEIVDYGVSGTMLTLTLDTDIGNYGEPGMYLDKVGEMGNPVAECREFHQSMLNSTKLSQAYMDFTDQLFECPCSLSRLGAQWWWLEETQVSEHPLTVINCYALSPVAKRMLVRLSGNPLNKKCCYKEVYPAYDYWWDFDGWYLAWRNAPYVTSGQYAGRILGHDPWWWSSSSRSYFEYDMLPHRQCCIDSDTCHLFNQIRPLQECSTTAEFVTGQALGDPHIKTLDGKDYTMNGWGEYNLVMVEELDFVLQGRTERMESNGVKINATVFVGFAAEEAGVKFLATMNSSGNGMDLKAAGADITLDFYNSSNFEKAYGDDSITVKKVVTPHRITAQASFGSLITVSVFASQGNLEFKLIVPTSLKGKLKGMMGNFNDDLSDEFILPDNTQLATNLTEREIFETFASQWQVTSSDSVFEYGDSEDATDYRHDDFEPLFMEDADPNVLATAISVCGGEDANACIFDYLATQNADFAQTTNQVNDQAEQEKRDLANSLPTLTATQATLTNGRWHLTSGQTSTIQLVGEDEDGDDLTYMIIGDIDDELTIDSDGLVTFTPYDNNPVSLNFQVNDTKGGVSAVLLIPASVCTNCSSHGTCDTSRTRQSSSNSTDFLLFGCNCLAAWAGYDCETDIDFCENEPCLEGQTCTDVAADVQGNDPVGYDCGSCPDGYQANDQDGRCSDINECLDDPCTNSVCHNTKGSYYCECNSGYSLDSSNSTLCNDIDECSQRLYDCSQECTNTVGSYNCSCYPLYDLNADGTSCDKQDVLPDECETCEHFCLVDGTTFESCSCNAGFKLDPNDDTKCRNIDECREGTKPCTQKCSDTTGSYNCSCYDGYQLAADGITCEECPTSFYGANCASKCMCNGKGSCDKVKGCVCREGWTGSDCNTDVDECVDEPCPVGELCVNTLGSHLCNCATGWKRDGSDCVDVDECESVMSHDCDLGVEDCVNTLGQYDCRCKTGFKRGSSGVCQDIDECETGTHGCEQLCENVVGLYNCKCRYGYRLMSDRKSCDEVSDVCREFGNLNCSHTCIVDRAAETAECVCNPGFYLDTDGETCTDINECDQGHTNLCSDKTTCSNTQGSFLCDCPSGSKLENDGRTCTTCSGGKWGANCGNDCACGMNAKECDPKDGCKCKTGYTGIHCEEDIDECSTGTKVCAGSTICINTLGSATCRCNDGFTKSGDNCMDDDECGAGTDDCGHVCTNTPGSFECSCYPGYSMVGGKCTDVDECALGLSSCTHFCINSNGGYNCRCQEGYRLDYDGATCIPSEQCEDNNDCAHICAKIDGVDTCSCPSGKELDDADGKSCNDVDLCDGSPCEHVCRETNQNTSIGCACSVGFKLNADEFNCTECVEGAFGEECSEVCSCNAATTESCDKTNGACTCISGYEGTDCTEDKNECVDGNICSTVSHSSCVDIPGSFICQCNAGYKKKNGACQECSEGFYGVECVSQCDCDTSHSTCRKSDGQCLCDAGWIGTRCDSDQNECDSSNDCSSAIRDHWSCFNLPGTYECRCDEGYHDNGTHCENFDECLAEHTNECDQNCTDAAPGYTCACVSGYTLNTTDRHQCHDVDECAASNGGCEQLCTNEEGSFVCSCNDGYTLKDDAVSCLKTKTVSMKLKFAVNVNNVIFDPLHASYKNLVSEVKAMLKTFLASIFDKVVDLKINKLSKGSLVVDAGAILDTSSDSASDVSGELIQALIVLSQSNVTVNGQTSSVQVTYGDTTIDENSDRCAILELVEPCETDETCAVVKNIPSCRRSEDTGGEGDSLVVVGLAVGIPLVAIVAVLIGVAVYFKTANKKLVRVVSRQGHYNENASRPVSAKSSQGLILNVEEYEGD